MKCNKQNLNEIGEIDDRVRVNIQYFQLNFITSVYIWPAIVRLLLLLLLKKVGSARLRESDVHHISPNTLAPQYQPIDRKKRKRKRVEDYSRDKAW